MAQSIVFAQICNLLQVEMANSFDQTEDHEALLTRLSQKPSVQSTLVLARETGAIVRMAGLISTAASLNATHSPLEPSSATFSENKPPSEGTNGSLSKAEEVARMVWNFVGTASGLVTGLDGEDEAKLLRLRTKKMELVIVPSELGRES